MIEVVHINCVNVSTNNVETLYVTSSEDYIANGVAYYPRLANMLDFSQTLFDNGTTAGGISIGLGTIVVNNSDGALDKYRTYGFDGQAINVYKPEDKYTTTSQTNLFFSGVVAYVEFGWSQITFYIKSRLEVLNVPMQTNTFAGTNSGLGGDGGLEGGSELAGKTKPQLFGRCSCVSGAPINDFYLMYAFNYDRFGNPAPISKVYNVFVKGIRYLSDGNDYVDEAALIAAISGLTGPPAGRYSTCLAKGIIALGSTALDGEVVADVADADESGCSAAQVVSRILQTNTDLVAGVDYQAAELLALDSFNACCVGIAISDGTTIADAINQILDSIGAWYMPDSYGVFRFGVVDLPSVLKAMGKRPLCTITKAQWADDIERIAVADQSQNIPAQSIQLQHTKNWAVQDAGSLAAAVDLTDLRFFTDEYRTSVATNQSVLLLHPLAPTLSYNTLLNEGVRLYIANGSFTVDVATAGNGWTYTSGAGATYSIGSGAIQMTAGSSTYSKIAQSLVPGVSLYAGPILIGFTVKAGYLVRVLLDSLLLGNMLTATYPVGGIQLTDTPVVLQVADSSVQLILSFTTPTATTGSQAMVGSIWLQTIQSTKTPDDEAARRLAVQSAYQERFTLTVPTQFYKQYNISVGELVTLQDDSRFDLQNGRDYLVIGVDPTNSDYNVKLDVWYAEQLQVVT